MGNEMTVTDRIRAHLEREFGLSVPVSIDQVRTHVAGRRSPDFKSMCDAKLAMGFIRYESVLGRAPNYLDYLTHRLAEYVRTGNLDLLQDVRNFAELEWQNPSRPGTYYAPEQHG
jgi:hypothetical protein